MELNRSLAVTIDGLDDATEYIFFLVGRGRFKGCFRIDLSDGAEIKRNRLILEFYDDAEIYANPYEPGTQEHEIAEQTTIRKIEHAIKESYYLRQGHADNGMKDGLEFALLRTMRDGHHEDHEVSGEQLSRTLSELLRTSKTLTIVEKTSGADKLLRELSVHTGELRVHRGEIHFSELSAEEKELYRIEEDDAIDPAELEENFIEHHRD